MLQDEPTTRARLGGLIVLYVDACICGLLIFAGLMRVSAIFGPGIMFYRGVVALALTGVALLVVLAIVLPFPGHRSKRGPQ